MNREVHVRFCERLGVKLPRSTRLMFQLTSEEVDSLRSQNVILTVGKEAIISNTYPLPLRRKGLLCSRAFFELLVIAHRNSHLSHLVHVNLLT